MRDFFVKIMQFLHLEALRGVVGEQVFLSYSLFEAS